MSKTQEFNNGSKIVYEENKKDPFRTTSKYEELKYNYDLINQWNKSLLDRLRISDDFVSYLLREIDKKNDEIKTISCKTELT